MELRDGVPCGASSELPDATFRESAIAMVRETGKSMAEVARRDLGINEGLGQP